MTRQKKRIYCAALLVSLLLLGFYSLLALRSEQKAVEVQLETACHHAGDALQEAIRLYSREMLFELDAYADVPLDPQSIPPLLQALEEGHEGRQYLIAGRNGKIVDPTGAVRDDAVDVQALRDARQAGLAVIRFPDAGDCLACVIPMPGHSDHYLLQVEPVDRLMEVYRDAFPLEPLYAAVYNESGLPVSGFFWGTADDSYELSQSVLFGASDYVASGGEILHTRSTGGEFNLYIPLAQPRGWFVGARVADADLPVHADSLRVHLLLLPLWLVGFVTVVLVDIQNDCHRRESLAAAGNLDPLTRLTSGAGLEKAMEEYFRNRPVAEYSMVVMDIVAFHRINALFGHDVGDSLLRLVGSVLQKHCICPARMYGDVFAFVGRTSPHLVTDVEMAIDKAIHNGFDKPYRNMIHLKFGVYPMLRDNHSFRQVIDGAQLALRDAKKLPERSQVVYDLHLQEITDRNRNIEANMLHALSEAEFVMHIQPKFEVLTGKCCGGEALVRWQSAEMGLLMPDSFIPLFEDNGFIVELDFYMLRLAMRFVSHQLDRGIEPLPLSVNMSRVTITFPTLLERLEHLLHSAPSALKYIEIEITESALENNHGLVVNLMHAIKGMGLQVSLDDFGSGFSSLTSLRDLPVDVLKIDKAFFQESDASHKSRKIIRNILNMASELGIRVVCEGVESERQVEFLRAAGNIVAQGYYYSKPLPSEQYEKEYLPQHPVRPYCERS